MCKSQAKNQQNEDVRVIRLIKKIIARAKYVEICIKHLKINFKVNSYYVGNNKGERNNETKYSSHIKAMEMVKK